MLDFGNYTPDPNHHDSEQEFTQLLVCHAKSTIISSYQLRTLPCNSTELIPFTQGTQPCDWSEFVAVCADCMKSILDRTNQQYHQMVETIFKEWVCRAAGH